MKKIIIILALIMPNISWGLLHTVGNGGSLCEKNIREIKTDIEFWINEGGAEGLKLPQGIALADYKSQMLKYLSGAEVMCTSKPLTINGAEKTCVNSKDITALVPYIPDDIKEEEIDELSKNKVGGLICNIKQFKDLDVEDKYILTHHEYAGLSDLEINKGVESDFVISDQISAYLEEEVSSRLVVKKNTKEFIPVCDRQLEIKEAIIESDRAGRIFARECKYITQNDLLSITKLSISELNAVEIRSEDLGFLNRLEYLTLNATSLRTIPGDIFQDKIGLKEVWFFGEQLTEIPNELFQFNNALVGVSFEGTRVKHLPRRLLAQVKNLDSFNFKYNYIETVPGAFFSKNKFLRSIFLSGNLIKTLPETLFFDNKYLKSINIDHNRIATLPEGIFSNNRTLQYVMLNNNFINEISDKLFRSNNELVWIDLSYNKLRYIPPSLFDNKPKLKGVDLTGNGLSDENIKELKEKLKNVVLKL